MLYVFPSLSDYTGLLVEFVFIALDIGRLTVVACL